MESSVGRFGPQSSLWFPVRPPGFPNDLKESEMKATSIRTSIVTIAAIVAALPVGPVETLQAQASGRTANDLFDPALYGAMTYRSIGPYRGGRATAAVGVPHQPYTFYMGSTGGGVWKTTNAGETWANVSDGFFAVGSIGAIAVAGSDPNVIYVGTGSACVRGNVSTGRGVYKSQDGGRTWTFIGLPDAGQIARIRVHPQNPDLLYLAALGNAFGRNAERGVYRSTDGGESWENVLFVSDSTGAVDLAMNPKNPREIYAGFWRAERKPWTLIDGASEGGIYKTTDGGDTWEKLAGGLPEGLTGRVGITVSPANPNRVWAIVNAHDPEGGVYRSEDAGHTWQRINRNRLLRQRAWYYSHIIADPQDENTVYALNTRFYRSIDGGKTFEGVSVPHGDVHDLWINPNDPDKMIVSNDGGAQVSMNGARTWSTMLNQPTAEFYRVTVDNQFPYRVYGAQQDNSTISVPSSPSGALTPQGDWYSVGGCESGHIAVDPRDPNVAYAGCYIGEITRVNRRTGESRNVMVYPVLVDGVAPKDLTYRFQWNAPIVISPHNPDVLYHTSNHVHRTRDGGMSWETISPDLTTDDEAKQIHPGGPLQHDHTSVEVYTTIFSFAESPHTPGELWAGSDDGRVHLSQDDGVTWQDVTPPGMSPDATVNTLDISSHQPGRVFLAVHRYRMDDFAPYVYRTNDYGQSWTLLTSGGNGIPGDHPVRVVREDPDRRGLLYAGTEFGMFVSFDDGDHWQTLQLNLPIVPITDLQVHRKDIVVSTQGRSFWILDDLTPLHQLTAEVAGADAHLFEPRDTYRLQRQGFRGGERGPEPPPNGAVIHYYLAQKPATEVTLEILDEQGEVVRRFSDRSEQSRSAVPAKAGMNRFVWNLQYAGPELTEDALLYLGFSGGPSALPGTYQVRLTSGAGAGAGASSQTRSFEVLKDPRLMHVTQQDLAETFDLLIRIRDRITETHDALKTIRSVREQTTSVAKRAAEEERANDLSERAEAISQQLTTIEEILVQVKAEAHQDPINFPPMLDNQFGYLYRYVNGGYGRPTQQAYERLDELESQLAEQRGRLRQVLMDDLERLNAMMQEQGLSGVVVPGRAASRIS
jgi:photosystem II stability/assembly factor-like uncharacterized protein